MMSHLFRESFQTEKAGIIFLSGNNHFGLWHSCELLIEFAKIAFPELVMIGKCHRT